MTGAAEYDVVVIGAGIVGLATARAILEQRSLPLCVLEAEDRPAAHQSGHNSGVIHSGLYYKPGSLKAKLTRAGRAALLEYCAQRGIELELCGKLVVAVDEEELPRLEELESRGRANGLEGMRRLSPEELREREPHVRGVDGLLVPETGIIDYARVTRCFAEDVGAAGGDVRLSACAGAIRLEAGTWTVETPVGEVRARFLVNCGGLQSDRVARRAGSQPTVRIVPFRGEYAALVPERRQLVRHLIYPVPDPDLPFLGVHFTRSITGEVEAGPSAVLALHRHGYKKSDVSASDVLGMLGSSAFRRMAWRNVRTGLEEFHRSFSRRAFARALQRLIPEIESSDLVPGHAGVRAQAVDPDGSLVDDFRLVEAEAALHVLNAPSPAATASMAIGDYLATRALSALDGGTRTRG